VKSRTTGPWLVWIVDTAPRAKTGCGTPERRVVISVDKRARSYEECEADWKRMADFRNLANGRMRQTNPPVINCQSPVKRVKTGNR
jgi:hypothetical protein